MGCSSSTDVGTAADIPALRELNFETVPAIAADVVVRPVSPRAIAEGEARTASADAHYVARQLSGVALRSDSLAAAEEADRGRTPSELFLHDTLHSPRASGSTSMPREAHVLRRAQSRTSSSSHHRSPGSPMALLPQRSRPIEEDRTRSPSNFCLDAVRSASTSSNQQAPPPPRHQAHPISNTIRRKHKVPELPVSASSPDTVRSALNW